jgi:hypothetical protein
MPQNTSRTGNGNGNRNGNGDGQERGQGQGQGRAAFVVGETVRVWKPTGVRKLKYGFQTSERIGGDKPDITPDEDLVVVERFGAGKALCKRRNGDQVIVHRNHIDPQAKYYAAKAQRQGAGGGGRGQQQGRQERPASPQERLQHAREEMERAKNEFEAAMQEVEEVAEELGSQDLPVIEEEENERAAG